MRNESAIEIFGWTDDGELKNELQELLHKYDESPQVHGGIHSNHRCASSTGGKITTKFLVK